MSGLSLRAVALVLAVFVSGLTVGALGFRALTRDRAEEAFEHPEGRGPDRMLLRALDRRVGLGHDQRVRVEEILRETHRERRSVLRPVEPALEVLRARTQTRIRSELRPDQWPAFDRLCEHLAERHRRGMRPGPPGPPEDAPPDHEPPAP